METILQPISRIAGCSMYRLPIFRRTSSKADNQSLQGIAMQEVIPTEADRVLRIWAIWKRAETGSIGRGYPKESAGFVGGGYSSDFDEMVERADRRTGAISDAILDEMGRTGYHRQQLAIWNKYLGDTARFRGDCEQLLEEGCRMFLIEAKRRGIAV